MVRGTELELAVSAGTHDALVGWLGANVQAAGSVELVSAYYDIRDQALARNRVVLYVHRQGSQRSQTLKAATVNTSGLSARHEREVPLQNDTLPADAFVISSAAEAADCVWPRAAALVPLLRIDLMCYL